MVEIMALEAETKMSGRPMIKGLHDHASPCHLALPDFPAFPSLKATNQIEKGF